MTTPLIAVYGAYGHIGRLVAAELRSRDQNAVLAGRDADALRRMGAELGYPVYPAALDDPVGLRGLTQQADVLIHCAGPFGVTGEPLVTAAIETGCHYVDHAVDPHHVRRLFEDFDAQAQEAAIAMVPGMSFHGGVGDLLAAVASDGLHDIRRVTTAYAVSGDRAIGEGSQDGHITFTDGEFHVGPWEPQEVVFTFPAPVGPCATAPFPSGEIVMIPRHVPTRVIETLHIAVAGPRAGAFTVVAQVVAAHSSRTVHVTGADLWRAGALASIEGALRLLEVPAKIGVLSPAEAFAPEPLLRTLERHGAFTHG